MSFSNSNSNSYSSSNNNNSCYTNSNRNSYDNNSQLILNFIGVTDLPIVDIRKTGSNPYIRAYIEAYTAVYDTKGRADYKRQCISSIVYTPKRFDAKSAIWNSYRNFGPVPPSDSVLVIEVYHAEKSSKPDTLLGVTKVAVGLFKTEDPKTLKVTQKVIYCSYYYVILCMIVILIYMRPTITITIIAQY